MLYFQKKKTSENNNKNRLSHYEEAQTIIHQHQGYGEKLLYHVMDKLDEYSSIFLEVRKSNFPAINLYLKFGFSELGIREKYYNDGEDAIIMKREFLTHGVV